MASISATIQLELLHINVLTKANLLPNKLDIDRWERGLFFNLTYSIVSIAFSALPKRVLLLSYFLSLFADLQQ